MESLEYNYEATCRTCMLVKHELKPLFETGAASMLIECQFAEVQLYFCNFFMLT